MSQTFQTVNPLNDTILQKRDYSAWSQVSRQLDVASAQFEKWSQLTLEERQTAFLFLVASLQKHQKDLAETITREMGKPLVESLAEINKCILLIEYCLLQSKISLQDQDREGYTLTFKPQGVIYGIMPWNFPVWQTLRFGIPAMLAGNTVMVKPADNVSETGEKLAKLFQEIEPLAGVYQNLSIDHSTSDLLIADPRVRGVSFTGSTSAGRHIAAQAGKLLKKCVLELGGNDAYVVFADSDIPMAAKKSFDARMLNAGQSCISAKRLFIEASVEKEFLQELKKLMDVCVVGDPFAEGTRVGPIARKDLKEKLQKQLETCVKEGAQVYFQKPVPQKFEGGFFFPPTILRQVNPEESTLLDEIFGPIFLVSTFTNEAEVVRFVNASPYGLGGAVFCKDVLKAQRVAEKMDTGSVAINDFFRSSPERPFGGVKDSGYGRELGPEGFLEFVNQKVIIK